jgi:hypothetical protein
LCSGIGEKCQATAKRAVDEAAEVGDLDVHERASAAIDWMAAPLTVIV